MQAVSFTLAAMLGTLLAWAEAGGRRPGAAEPPDLTLLIGVVGVLLAVVARLAGLARLPG